MSAKINNANSWIIIALLILLLSSIALFINNNIYKYPGNDYFPTEAYGCIILIALIGCGAALQWGKSSRATKTALEIMYFALIMMTMLYASNAIQYTPYNTIDKKILIFESSLHMNLEACVAWTQSQPLLQKAFEFSYNSLSYQLCYLPLLLIILQKTARVREFYFLLLISALLGYTFYYFFPTTAPASIMDQRYFSLSQQATGLKFSQIHHYIAPTTKDGGMISLPSFHAIWAWLCIHITRTIPLLHWIIIPLNATLILSCVFLGWHFFSDIAGSIIVLVIAHRMYKI